MKEKRYFVRTLAYDMVVMKNKKGIDCYTAECFHRIVNTEDKSDIIAFLTECDGSECGSIDAEKRTGGAKFLKEFIRPDTEVLMVMEFDI